MALQLQKRPFEIRHQIPGRIRLYIPELRDDRSLSERLRQVLSGVEGVYGLRINRTCASLIIWHRRAEPLSEAALRQVFQPIFIDSGAVPRTLCSEPAPQVGRQRLSLRWFRRHLSPSKSQRRPLDPQTPAGCWLCQVKLRLARWFLTDLWRCWLANPMPQRPQN